MQESAMNRSLANRLVSLAMALVVTFGIAGGIHSLAATEAATAAAQMADSAAATPLCARV
jgi:hypothetical protein